MVLIRWAALGASSCRARQWAYADTSSGFRPKGYSAHNAPLFLRLEDYAPLVDEKYCVSGAKYGELFTINAHMFQRISDMCFLDGTFNASSKVLPLYIGLGILEVYKATSGYLLCYIKPLFTIVISSLAYVHRSMKVERLWREALKGLYSY